MAQRGARVSPRHFQRKSELATCRMSVDHDITVRLADGCFQFRLFKVTAIASHRHDLYTGSLNRHWRNRGCRVEYDHGLGNPRYWCHSGGLDRPKALTFSSKQDQVALHLGVGAGAQVCIKSVPGHRGGCHIVQSGGLSHLEVDMGRCC